MKSLRIYVAGPYSAPTGEMVKKNIEQANQAAMAVAAKGHIPFVPHTMLSRWQDQFMVDRATVMRICHEWLRHCDALLFLGSSPGSESELALAGQLSLPVFRSTEELPAISVSRDNGF